MISVTAVEVTSDGSYATIYLSVLGLSSAAEDMEKQQQDVIEGMNHAKGLIRKEIGCQVKLRHVPDLIFKIDRSMEYGRHIDKIINDLDIKHDSEEEDADEE